MTSQTIDTALAKRLAEASAIQGASIIGQPGGWCVILKLGTQEKTLGAQRSDKPRLWRSLDRCVQYVTTELRIVRFELLDATNHDAAAMAGQGRADASERLRAAHAAAAHDQWFRAQVDSALDEADDPTTEWVTQEEADAGWSRQRAALQKRSKRGAA